MIGHRIFNSGSVAIVTAQPYTVERELMNLAGKFNFQKAKKNSKIKKMHRKCFELKRQLQLMIKRSGIETKLNIGTG